MKTRRIVVLTALAVAVGLGIAWNYVQDKPQGSDYSGIALAGG